MSFLASLWQSFAYIVGQQVDFLVTFLQMYYFLYGFSLAKYAR